MTTLSLFQDCMDADPKEKRKMFTKRILTDANTLLLCFDKYHVKYKLVGSVARQIAHSESDLDIHIDPTYKHEIMQCTKLTQVKSTKETCGLYDQYRTKTPHGYTVDITTHRCAGTDEKKWNRFPILDDAIKDIMFCTNSVLRRNNYKIATHDDHALSPWPSFVGVYGKEKLYSGKR